MNEGKSIRAFRAERDAKWAVIEKMSFRERMARRRKYILGRMQEATKLDERDKADFTCQWFMWGSIDCALNFVREQNHFADEFNRILDANQD